MPLTEDPIGIKFAGKRVNSKSLVEITDLLSEGPIDGLVSKDYDLFGTAGNVGWTTVIEKNSVPDSAANSYLNSVYLNNIPILSKENQFNFQDVQFSKSYGEPNGEYSNANLLRTQTKRTIAINERLRGPSYNVNTGYRIGPVDQFAKFYKILNKDCSSVEVNIKFSALSLTDRSMEAAGNVKITDNVVDYIIDYRPIYSNSISNTYFRGATMTVEGRISSPYVESTTVNFLSGLISDLTVFLGWEIKIYRITNDPISSSSQSSTFIDSISEIFGSKFSYPNSAVASFNFDAEYFSQIPNRSYDTRLLKVKVPSNYDPIKKSYTSHWDGSFKANKEWTDNPAWCFYDLVTNTRYGLGKYIDPRFVDRWTLYEIAQYCDVLVPDGFGGIEPRFTCNLLLQSREEAYKVINDMASIFRGISYYAAGNIYVNQDNDKKRPIYQFTNASVEDGEFLYSSSSSKLRRNVAIVRYNDKTNLFKPAIELTEDVDGIRKNGIKEIEVAAFGCTSRGQASRLGKWILFTENLETETVSFTAGLEANYLRPGDIVTVSDQNRNVRRRGGRLFAFDGTDKTLTLDSPLHDADSSKNYFISVVTPSFFYDASLVDLGTSADIQNIRRSQVQNFYFNGSQISISGNYSIINLNPNYPNLINNFLLPGAVWTLSVSGNEQGKPFPREGSDFTDLSELSSKNETFRVLSVEESEPNTYKVAGIEYNPLKFIAIESGLSFDSSYSNIVPSTATSASFRITSAGNSRIIEYTINSDLSSSSLGALSNYVVFAKSTTTPADPWKKGDYRENNPGLGGSDNEEIINYSLIPDSRYKIATLSAPSLPSVTSSFLPSENNVYYYFKFFAANSSFATSNALSLSTEIIRNNEPIKDITVKNLRLTSDLIATNNPGEKNTAASIYDQAAPTFNFNWGSEVISDSIFASNFHYRLTFRPNSLTNKPATTIFFQVTGFLPSDSLNPNYTFNILDNINSNGGTPVREYDVIVEAHDAHGNSSAGGNFLTSAPVNGRIDSSFSNANGYDILTVNNPRLGTPLINENGVCPSYASYCTEQFFTYEKEIRIHLTSIPSDFSDVAGGFVYISNNVFTSAQVLGKTIAECNNAGIEVQEFKKFTLPIIVRPTSNVVTSQARKNYIAYSLYDSFDKNWRDLASSPPALETLLAVSPVVAAPRPEIRSFGGEGYKVWVMIDLDAGHFKSFGIKRIEIVDMSKLDARHPYKLFKGYRKYRCDIRDTYRTYDVYWYDFEDETDYLTDVISYDIYCGYAPPKIANGVFKGDEGTLDTYDPANLDHYQEWIRFRCYFADDVFVPYKKNAQGAPLVDTIYSPYAITPFAGQTLYDGNYNVIGINASNKKYRGINSLAAESLTKLMFTPGNIRNGTIINEYFETFDNNPEYNHHPAGFGQGFGGLEKNTKYFDLQFGRLIDHGFLSAGYFGVLWSNDDTQEKDL